MAHVHGKFMRGGNSLDYQFMHLGDVDVCNTIEDGDLIQWSESAARFIPKPQSEIATTSSLPTGLIVMWSGLLANIPSGWLLCDGNNGTPDLRDRFIVGAAAAQNPGASGGQSSHAHADHAPLAHSGLSVSDHAGHTHPYSEVVNHTHGVTDPGHTHVQNAHAHGLTGTPTDDTSAPYTNPDVATGGTSGAIGNTGSATATNQNATTGVTTQNPTGGVASGTTGATPLSHGVTPPSDHAAQSHDSVAHLPPYFALAFIMKA